MSISLFGVVLDMLSRLRADCSLRYRCCRRSVEHPRHSRDPVEPERRSSRVVEHHPSATHCKTWEYALVTNLREPHETEGRAEEVNSIKHPVEGAWHTHHVIWHEQIPLLLLHLLLMSSQRPKHTIEIVSREVVQEEPGSPVALVPAFDVLVPRFWRAPQRQPEKCWDLKRNRGHW